MADTKRLFVAVPVDERVKSAIAQLAHAHHEKLPYRRWVHAADYHITLQFLGDTDAPREADVRKLLREACRGAAPFRLAADGFGTFGPPNAPNALWLGVRGDLQPLRRLHASVEAAMERAGFAKEAKPFRPHITLARKYAGFAPPADVRALPSLPHDDSAEWTASAVVLYMSRLGSSPMYEAVESFPLG